MTPRERVRKKLGRERRDTGNLGRDAQATGRSHRARSGKRPLRIGLAAFPVTSDPGKNFDQIERLTREAAKKGARLVLFPEGALSGYYGEHFLGTDEIDADRIEALNREVGRLAREAGVHVVVGTLVQQESGPANALVAFAPSGRRAATYVKRHLTRRDHEFYVRGGGPAFVRVDGWKVGLLLCFDARFPVWSHEYARRGADLLVYSFNMCGRRGVWKRPVMEATLRTRAAENNVFVAAVNDARAYPHVPAFAVDRGGCTIVRAFPRRPTVVIADLDPARDYAIEKEILAEQPVDYDVAADWAHPRRGIRSRKSTRT